MIPPEFRDLDNKPSLWACVLARDAGWGWAILGCRAPSSLPSSPTQAHTHSLLGSQMFTKSRSDCLPLDYWPEECVSKASGGEILVVKLFAPE